MAVKNSENIKSEFMSLLVDYYGDLLSEKQSDVFRYYYEENLSLTEIAAELGVSKQAISKMLKRTRAQLEDYEKKLLLMEKHKQYEKALLKINKKIFDAKKLDDESSMARVKTLNEAKRLIAGLEI